MEKVKINPKKTTARLVQKSIVYIFGLGIITLCIGISLIIAFNLEMIANYALVMSTILLISTFCIVMIGDEFINYERTIEINIVEIQGREGDIKFLNHIIDSED